MRGLVILLLVTPPALADDERFVERAKLPHITKEHTAERAGTDAAARRVQPSVPKHTVLGYVNGTTFGSDYVGLWKKPGRVFPGFWPSRAKSFSDKYATDGPIHVPDPIAAQPWRKAVKEAKEERHK